MAKVPIVLFTTAACPYCEAGRVFLRAHEIDFVEKNVMADINALQDMLYLTGHSEVPVLSAGYQAAIGFDERRWLEVLAHAKEIEREDPFRLPEQFGPDPLKF